MRKRGDRLDFQCQGESSPWGGGCGCSLCVYMCQREREKVCLSVKVGSGCGVGRACRNVCKVRVMILQRERVPLDYKGMNAEEKCNGKRREQKQIKTETKQPKASWQLIFLRQ